MMINDSDTNTLVSVLCKGIITGAVTDDTQMTLFPAEGLIRAWVRGCLKGITTYSGVTAHAYLRWLQTQGERPTCDIDFGTDETGWLFQQRELQFRK